MADPAFPPPFRPSAVVVRHRFVSASHLAGRIRRLHAAPTYLDRCVEYYQVTEACEAFARAAGKPEVAAPEAFLEHYCASSEDAACAAWDTDESESE